MSGMIVWQKGNHIYILENNMPLSKMKGGKIIICKQCNKQEVVNEHCLCDIWNLCKDHVTQKLKRMGH